MKKVFVNGSFDLLHCGHIQLLEYAKKQGDFLFVAIDSDKRISQKKGLDRPLNDQKTRLTVMNNLKAVDQVEIFNSDDELTSIIKNYSPDVMVVGSDWKGQHIVGSEYAKSLIFFDRLSDESTTKTIENYINRRRLYR